VRATQQDILDAIRAAIGPVKNDPGISVLEYAEAEGVSRGVARRILDRGVQEGKLFKGTARKPMVDGRLVLQPVYQAKT